MLTKPWGQRESGNTKSRQGEPRGARGSQGKPRKRKKDSQGEPGGARGSFWGAFGELLDQTRAKRSLGEYREVKRSQGEQGHIV